MKKVNATQGIHIAHAYAMDSVETSDIKERARNALLHLGQRRFRQTRSYLLLHRDAFFKHSNFLTSGFFETLRKPWHL